VDAWVSPGHTPARATVEAKLAAPGYHVEIMVVARSSYFFSSFFASSAKIATNSAARRKPALASCVRACSFAQS